MTKRKSSRKSARKTHPKPRKAKAGRASASSKKKPWTPKRLKDYGSWEFRVRRRKPRFEVKTYAEGMGKVPKAFQSYKKTAKAYKRKAKKREVPLVRRYQEELTRLMKKRNYAPSAIEKMKTFSPTGIVRKRAIMKVRFTAKRYKYEKRKYYSKKAKRHYTRKVRIVTHYKVGGKWVPKASFRGKIRAAQYNAVIAHYRELYGLNRKEAQKLYRMLRNAKWGQEIYIALY